MRSLQLWLESKLCRKKSVSPSVSSYFMFKVNVLIPSWRLADAIKAVFKRGGKRGVSEEIERSDRLSPMNKAMKEDAKSNAFPSRRRWNAPGAGHPRTLILGQSAPGLQLTAICNPWSRSADNIGFLSSSVRKGVERRFVMCRIRVA